MQSEVRTVSDDKKKGYDPLFDEIFKGVLMPDLKPRERPRLPDIMPDIGRKFYAPAGLPKLDPFYMPWPTFGDPWSGPVDPLAGKSLDDMIAEIQARIGPPKPTSPHDERLFAMSTDLGFKPIIDTKFGLDFKHKTLMTDPTASPAMRVLSIGHELGHAQRFKAGKLKIDVFFKWNTTHRMDPQVCRHVMTEEIMAWRWGLRTLREIGCRFSNSAAVRLFRRECLSSYRNTVRIHVAAVRRLKLEE